MRIVLALIATVGLALTGFADELDMREVNAALGAMKTESGGKIKQLVTGFNARERRGKLNIAAERLRTTWQALPPEQQRAFTADLDALILRYAPAVPTAATPTALGQ